MKKTFMIFLGFLLLITMLGLLFFSGAIYDAEEKHKIESFFFEPNAQANRRISAPVSVDSIPYDFLRDMMLARFINEYFYIIPDVDNAQKRLLFQNPNGKEKTALYNLARGRKSVCDTWAKTVAPDIVDLAGKNVLRTANILNISESDSGHLVVEYELKTWTKPNDILAKPDVTVGKIYINVTKPPIRVVQTKEALERLQKGKDPMSAFSFEVLDVIQK